MNQYRTHNCNEISLADVGKEVKISGFVQTIRDLGGVVFLDIRDMYGVTQVVTSGEAQDVDFASHIPIESTVCVEGTVRKRDEETFNPNIKTGEVEIFIKTNVGENENKLTQIASGGEMSRIMLGIKKVLADVDKVPVLIFDEIDTGISGIAAKKVGIKMKEISKTHQVICVTHLAQIAAKGDYNYFIKKEVKNNKTNTKIEQLDEEGVLREIARIATGEINDISIQHAKELRKEKVA